MAKSTKVKPRQPGVAEKLTADNMAFSSCNVKAGTAIGLIVATGMKTGGTSAALLNARAGGPRARPVDAGQNRSGRADQEEEAGMPPDTKSGQSLSRQPREPGGEASRYMAVAVCVVVFVVGVALGTKDPESPDRLVALPDPRRGDAHRRCHPEGLPLCVTIALTGCSEMVKEILMRKIAAVETLGSSIICTDRPALTGKMTPCMYTGARTTSRQGFQPHRRRHPRRGWRRPRMAAFAPPLALRCSDRTPRSSSRPTPRRARRSGCRAATPPRRRSSSPGTRLASSSRIWRRRSSASLRFPSPRLAR